MLNVSISPYIAKAFRSFSTYKFNASKQKEIEVYQEMTKVSSQITSRQSSWRNNTQNCSLELN